MNEKTKKSSERLKKWRESLKITQNQAAEILKVSVYTYRNWEQTISRVPGSVWAFIDLQQTGDEK